MGLSSNSLIHLTDKKSDLIKILTGSFKIKYCHEVINLKGKKPLDMLVPVVSFFDIPFSQLHKHFESYGHYGIGLSKSWARKNKLNPVLYVDNNSNIGNGIRHIFDSITKVEKRILKWNNDQKATLDILRYLKNYQDTLIRKDKEPIEDYRFSDEREWRHVLDSNSTHQFIGWSGNGTHEEISALKARLNSAIKDERLAFEPNDINYIIVKYETERDEILKLISDTYGENLLQKEMRRLNSRVISTQQVLSDF